jgi:hypothetical protein
LVLLRWLLNRCTQRWRKEKIPQSSAGVGKEDLTHGKTKRKEKFSGDYY